MRDPHAKLFRAWRDQQDTAALASLFDQVAPDLVRLALHLSRGPADAEDLVQQTFLTAMESAQDFAPDRPLLPWLTGILRHRAHNARRRAGRELQSPSRTPETATLATDGDPAAQALAGETAQHVIVAIDRLAEPYRQPALLHLRHGMAPADIAHVLGRSPGTVRVQLHRAMQRLRGLLPAGLIGAVAAWLSAGRGLAMVRQQVLQHAHQIHAAHLVSAATGATGGAAMVGIGGYAMTKKILFGALALFSAGLVVFGWHGAMGGGESPRATERNSPLTAAAAGERRGARGAVAGSAGREAMADRMEVPPSSEAAVPPLILRGRVLDGDSGAAVAGAEVGFFPPELAGMDELRRRFAGVMHAGANGNLHARSPLRMPQELPFAVLNGDEQHPFALPPAASVRPSTAVHTDDQGRFELAVEAELGKSGGIRVAAAGYGSQFLTLPLSPRPGTGTETETQTIEIPIFTPRVLRGHVVDATGAPLKRAVHLLLVTGSRYWEVSTDSEGAFEVEVTAPRLQVSCRTDWLYCDAWRPMGKESWRNMGRYPVYSTLTVTDCPVQLRIVPPRGVWLHVTDRPSGRPLEFVHLLARERDGDPNWVGRFHAPAGLLLVRPDGNNVYGHDVTRVIVWSKQHAATVVDLPADDPTEPIEVALEPGALPVTDGVVQEHGAPLERAIVQFRAVQVMNQRSGRRDQLVDQGRTDRDGTFTLAAPEGEYLVEVFRPGSKEVAYARLHSLPLAIPLVIELASVAAIDVVIRDAAGRPAVDYPVSGGTVAGRTDAEGRVRLQPLAAGQYRVGIPPARTEGSWIHSQTKAVEVQAGEVARVEFEVAEPRQIRLHLRIADPTVRDFRGWKAIPRIPPYSREAEVGPTGDIVLCFAIPELLLRITAADGRTWQVEVPLAGPEDRDLRLAWSGLKYSGTLRDELGRPLGGARIRAWLPDGTLREVGVVADRSGHFELAGLEDRDYVLLVDRGPQAGRDDPFRGSRFIPAGRPRDPTVPFDLRVPSMSPKGYVGRGLVTIRGEVRSAIDGRPAGSGAVVMIRGRIEQTGGHWLVASRPIVARTDEQGRYTVGAPEAKRYSVRWRAADAKEMQEKSVLWSGTATMQCDLLVGEMPAQADEAGR